jgi:anti-sigma factor RsiW
VNAGRCQHRLDGLSEFVDGAASDELCAEIERHLADCDDCRVMVDTLRKTVSLYRDLPQPAMPAGARERLYKSLDLEDFLDR